MIKPLYGFMSDAVPLFGYRRRSYLALCGVLGAASWAALGGAVSSPSAGAGARAQSVRVHGDVCERACV